MKTENIYQNWHSSNTAEEEVFEDILKRSGIRIERILSTGQSSPENFWYDQDEDEWVLLLSGEAVLEFSHPAKVVTLSPGDYLLIEAHRKHRVIKTANPTVWLTLWMPSS